MARLSTCRSCGADIQWRRNTRTGTTTPIDAQPHPKGNIVLEGSIGYQVLGKSQQHDGATYMAHFVTCPDAESWRRNRGSTGDDH